VVTWVAVGLLLAVVAGYVILQQRPQWLVSAHILRVVEPGGTHAAAPATTTTGPHQAAAVVPAGASGPSSSAYSVDTKDFAVNIITTGPCWVQVTSSESFTPLIVGVQPAGIRLSYPAKGTMTVQVGSSAVIVDISVKGKVVFYNAPRVTPYTYVFAPSAR